MKAKTYFYLSMVRHYLNAPLRHYCYAMIKHARKANEAKTLEAEEHLWFGEITWLQLAVKLTKIALHKED